MKIRVTATCMGIAFLALSSASIQAADKTDADANAKVKTLFVDGEGQSGFADKVNKKHAEMTAQGWRFADLREFLRGMIDEVGAVHARRGTLRGAFAATHARLAPKFGHWPIFEHCLPFNVQRLWDELDGVDWPHIWTMERDREVWARLQG